MLRTRRTTPPRGEGPEISVVIPTWNRPRELEDCLAGFAAQTVPAARFEVVVVDDGSDVDLQPLERRFAPRLRLRFERRSHAGAAAARNAAVALARAPLLVLGEDDVKPLPTLIEYCLDFHRLHSGEGDALLFHVTPDARLNRSPLMHYLGGSLKAFPSAEGVHGGASFLAGAVSCKRSLFRHGEFDPDLERVDDAELGLRLAARVDLRIHYERIPQATFIRALAAEEALGREYAIAYCWQRVRRRLAHDARASRLLGPLPDPYRHPERFVLDAPAVEQALQAIHWLESGFGGRNPRFLPADQHRSLRMLHRLYNTAIAFAQARGWRDAREGRPPGLALPAAARVPPQPPPAPAPEIVAGGRGIRKWRRPWPPSPAGWGASPPSWTSARASS